jgi:hypothetical protein
MIDNNSYGIELYDRLRTREQIQPILDLFENIKSIKDDKDKLHQLLFLVF